MASEFFFSFSNFFLVAVVLSLTQNFFFQN
jgi:hypothetical protein